ncbi:MAG: hypothetical protein HRU33_23185 [Rhodobacteraceae bacterium]|nr:hypothetical protein [Paracoccaceae bacterium]
MPSAASDMKGGLPTVAAICIDDCFVQETLVAIASGEYGGITLRRSVSTFEGYALLANTMTHAMHPKW